MGKEKFDKIEPYYQKRAESIVDMLFDAKLFSDNLTRKDLQSIEDYIAYEFHSGINGALRVKEIMARHTATKDLNKEEN